jgi:hypothetical protein
MRDSANAPGALWGETIRPDLGEGQKSNDGGCPT